MARPKARPSLSQTKQSKHRLALAKVISILFLTAFFTPLTRLALSPSHGGIPAAAYDEAIAVTIFLIVSGACSSVSAPLPSEPLQHARLIPLIAASAPTLHLYMTPLSRSCGPVLSALLIKSVTCAPILALDFYIAIIVFASIPHDSFSDRVRLVMSAGTAGIIYFLAQYICMPLPQSLARGSPGIGPLEQMMIAAVLYAVLFPSRAWVLVLIVIIGTIVASPHALFGIGFNSVVQGPLYREGFALLARSFSTTGYVSVLENREEGYRVLRCDHSLLGGQWVPGLGNWERSAGFPSEFNAVNEPLFSIFVLLEAVRLARGLENMSQPLRPEPDLEPKALVM